MSSQTRLGVFAAATVGGVGELLRRRRARRATPPEPPPPPPPPMTTQSSPGQIADLQQAYGADMGAPPLGTDAPEH
jgi:hypothetical protein